MSVAARTTIEGFRAFAAETDERVIAPSAHDIAQMTASEVDRDIDRRRRYLANLPTVVSPVVATLTAQLTRLVADNAARAPGDKVHIGFQGVAGIGKTTAILRAARTIHNQAIQQQGEVVKIGQVRAQHVPVLYCTAPAVQSFKQLIGTVLRPFDARSNGNAEAMTEQLLHLLNMAQTQVVVIDDAHALRGRSRASVVTADSLKALINRISCTVVFVGTGLENSVLFGKTIGGMDDPAAQLRNRMIFIEHPQYRRPTREDPGEFVKLIGALETPIAGALMHHRLGTLTSATTVRWMYDRTEGIPARVAKWMSAAAVTAVGADECVTRELLENTLAPGLNSI